MNGSYGGGWMGMGGPFMLIFWVLLIVGAVLLVRWLLAHANGPDRGQRRTALDILQERYARGEIGREEYEQKRRDLDT